MGIIRDSFIVVKNWAEAIEALPEENQLETYKALVQYGITGKIPEGISKICNAMLISFSKEMEYNIAKYNASVENGKRGGRPSKNKQETEETQDNLDDQKENLEKPSKTQHNPDITQDNPDITQHNPDITLYDNDNVYVYVNKLVKENKNNKLINQVRAHAYTHESLIAYLKEKFNLLYSFYPSHSSDIDFLLNEMAGLIAEADTGPLKFNNHSFTGEEMAAIIDEISVDELPGLVNSLIHNSGIKNKTLYILGGLLNILNEKIKKGG